MTTAQAMVIQAAIEEMRRDGTDLSQFQPNAASYLKIFPQNQSEAFVNHANN